MFGFGAGEKVDYLIKRIDLNDKMHMDLIGALSRSADIAALRERIINLEAHVFVKPQHDAAVRAEAATKDLHA